MHGMDNITLSPETYEIELRRRPIVSTSQLKLQAGLAQTQFATAASTRNVPWVKRFTSAMSALCRLSLRLRKYRCTTTNVERGQWPILVRLFVSRVGEREQRNWIVHDRENDAGITGELLATIISGTDLTSSAL